jgi:hypothetical protein
MARNHSSKIQLLCGLAVVAALFYSWLWTLTFVNRVMIYRNREHYRPATFIVTGATYNVGEEGGDSWWLSGTVDGREERLMPVFERGKRPRSAGDLLARNPKGSTVEILYNPDATETLMQGETLRAIEMRPDFWEREAVLRHRLGVRVLVPVPVTLAIYLTVRFKNRRARRESEVTAGEPSVRQL